MINLICDELILNKNFAEKFLNFCKKDSFGCRVYSRYLSYGYKFDFVDFWVQTDDDENITSAVCRMDNDFVLSLSNCTDFVEISEFLKFQQISTLTFSNRFSHFFHFDLCRVVSGKILKYTGIKPVVTEYDVISPDIKEYYSLLEKCKDRDFIIPECNQFLSDTMHRLNNHMCMISGIRLDDELISCAMTVSHTDFSVILGAVATARKHRKRGCASNLIIHLSDFFNSYNCDVYLYTATDSNTMFYQSLNFYICDEWVEYTFI